MIPCLKKKLKLRIETRGVCFFSQASDNYASIGDGAFERVNA